MIMGRERRRVDLVMKARRNSQFGRDTPSITHKQHEPISASINLGCVIERCLGGIYLLQQEAGDWTAAHLVEAGFSACEGEVSRLPPEKDGGVLRKSHLAAERDRVLPPGHRY